MEALKSVGSVLFGLSFLVMIGLVAATTIIGITLISINVFQYVSTASNILTTVCVAFLPLSLFDKTRIVPTYVLYASSFVFGLCVWVYGFLVTYEIWGGIGVFIGVVPGFLGIIPLGIIAASLHAEWLIVDQLTYGLVLTFGARSLALSLAEKIDRAEGERRERMIEGEVVS